MSFGGAAAAMISSIKNNRRSRPSAFKKLKNLEKGTYKKVVFTKKATPEQLKKIKEKAIREDRIILIKKVIYLILFVIIAIYVIGFVKF